MVRKYDMYVVDAFTQTLFMGNTAGVVADASGLTDAEMQAIAREINVSETAFVFPPSGAGHDLRVRFFTPKVEVPICGHATIATHHVLAELGHESGTKAGRRYIQKTASGVLPVDLRLEEDGLCVIMSQTVPEITKLSAELPEEKILTALGVHEADLDHRFPVGAAFSGEYTVFVGVRSRSLVDALAPDMQGLSTAYATYLVFTLDSPDAEVLTYCRMFAPAYGISEDPVTGMANGQLGAYLVSHNWAPENSNTFRFVSRQGVAIGRPGEVEVIIGHEGRKVTSVQIAGHAVIVLRAKLTLP